MSSTTHRVHKHRSPLRLLAAACIAAAAVVAAPAIASAVPSYSVGSLDLASAGVPEVRQGLESGQFTSVDLVRAYLDRIQKLSIDGPHLNAVRSINPCRAQMRSPCR